MVIMSIIHASIALDYDLITPSILITNPLEILFGYLGLQVSLSPLVEGNLASALLKRAQILPLI